MTTNFEKEEAIISESQIMSNSNGFVEGSGTYPKPEYWHQSSVNLAARNAKFHKLDISNGIPFVDLDLNAPLSAQYPLNDVHETPAGHVFEFNDTLANERILLKHTIGAGIDIKPDGTILINSKGNRVEIVDDNYYMAVEGDGHLTYYGNLSLNVSGDLDMDVGGDFYLRVGGSWMINVLGDYRKKIVGHWQEIVQKSKNITNIGNYVSTTLGTVIDSVKGKYTLRSEDKIEVHAGDNLYITAANEFIQTAPNMNIAAQDMSVIGSTGTIGGQGIYMYNFNSYTEKTVHAETVSAKAMFADTFFGDLSGDALRAVSANVSAGLGGGGASVRINNVQRNNAQSAKPTATNMEQYVENSSLGYKKISIDPTEELKNSIEKTAPTGGVTDRILTTSEVRAKLKDPLNKANNEFLKEQFEFGVLSPQFARLTSPSGSTSQTSVSIPRIESEPINGMSDPYSRVQPREKAVARTVNIAPSPEFNPTNFKEITQKTELDTNIPISKFMGSLGDRKSIEKIDDMGKRIRIAQNLVPHTKIFNTFKTLKKLNDINFVVAEGVYIPVQSEKLTPNGFIDLSTEGRAIAYEVYDTAGKINYEKTFEMAEAIKDFCYFDSLELRYDDYDPSGIMNMQIAVITPEINSSYTNTYKMNVATYYNDILQSSSDLILLTSDEFDQTNEFSTNPNVGVVDMSYDPADPNVPVNNSNTQADNSYNGPLGKITTKNGLSTSIAKVFVPNFQGLINDLEAAGYEFKVLHGYSNRNIANSSKKSWHAHGAAIDINPAQNYVQYGVSFGAGMVTDMPNNIRELAAKHGLGWGGDWNSKKDPMHFSAAKNEGGNFNIARNGNIPISVG